MSRLQDMNDGDFDWDDRIYVSRAFHIFSNFRSALSWANRKSNTTISNYHLNSAT